MNPRCSNNIVKRCSDVVEGDVVEGDDDLVERGEVREPDKLTDNLAVDRTAFMVPVVILFWNA